MALFCVILANSGRFRAHWVKVHVRHILHFVAHFISSHVVQYLDCIFA